jgi:hypothetical protein
MDLTMGKTKDLLEGHERHRGEERGVKPPSSNATYSINALSLETIGSFSL